MPWLISLRSIDGVVESVFTDVVLATLDDVARWEREVGVVLQQQRPPILLLINLDGLIVKPAAAGTFGEARARVLGRFATKSARYGGDGWTRTAIHTSSIRHQTHGSVFASRQEALESLRGRADTDPP